MRNRTWITCALALTALFAMASAAPGANPGAGAHAKAKPLQGVKLQKCGKVARWAAFSGRMRAIEGSQTLSMRFTLFERLLPSAGFQEVAAPGLGQWHRSRPAVRGFRYRQAVRGLNEAAHYRMGVEFRWYAADGELLRQASRRSRVCRQPGRLPNLQVKRVVRREDGKYYVRVANEGKDLASGASVQLFADNYDAGSLNLREIPAGKARWSTGFSVPGCTGSVQAVADPLAVVRESAEDDNARTLPCMSVPAR